MNQTKLVPLTLPRRVILKAALAAALAVTTINAFAQTAPILDDEEGKFFGLINDYRRQNGLEPLQLSPILTTSSKWMSGDMAAKNYFSHTDSLGRDAGTRLQAFGYPSNVWWGENIAAGNWTAAGTFDQWRNSAPHNANMLNPNYKVIGIGRAYGAGATYAWYWTTDFGSYVDPGSTDTPPGVTTTTTTTTTTTPTSPTSSGGSTKTNRGKRNR